MNKLLLFLMLALALASTAARQAVVTTSEELTAVNADSVDIDTVEVPLQGFVLLKVAVGDSVKNCTRLDYQFEYSENYGTSWTILTESVDADLSDVAIGTSGVVRVGADSSGTWYFAKPAALMDTGARSLAEARGLLFATDFRVNWNKVVGADSLRIPELSVTINRYPSAAAGLE